MQLLEIIMIWLDYLQDDHMFDNVDYSDDDLDNNHVSTLPTLYTSVIVGDLDGG